MGGVDQQHRYVGILGTRPSRRDHRPVEPAARSENAGRVDVDELRIAFDRDAEKARARRLRLGRDDRQLAANQPVQQGRLAGIGGADQRDITAARRFRLCRISIKGHAAWRFAQSATSAWVANHTP